MTNFECLKQRMTLGWVADAIEDRTNCDICPALALCEQLYPACCGDEYGELAAEHCHETIVKWLEMPCGDEG